MELSFAALPIRDPGRPALHLSRLALQHLCAARPGYQGLRYQVRPARTGIQYVQCTSADMGCSIYLKHRDSETPCPTNHSLSTKRAGGRFCVKEEASWKQVLSNTDAHLGCPNLIHFLLFLSPIPFSFDLFKAIWCICFKHKYVPQSLVCGCC